MMSEWILASIENILVIIAILSLVWVYRADFQVANTTRMGLASMVGLLQTKSLIDIYV